MLFTFLFVLGWYTPGTNESACRPFVIVVTYQQTHSDLSRYCTFSSFPHRGVAIGFIPRVLHSVVLSRVVVGNGERPGRGTLRCPRWILLRPIIHDFRCGLKDAIITSGMSRMTRQQLVVPATDRVFQKRFAPGMCNMDRSLLPRHLLRYSFLVLDIVYVYVPCIFHG